MKYLFLNALRKKFRFQTSKGNLNIEQLFELNNQELHELYLSLESSIQKSKGLLGRKGNSEVEEKLQIVKAVFDQLEEERQDRDDAVAKKALKAKVLEAIDEKEIDELKGKSKKELLKMAKNL